MKTHSYAAVLAFSLAVSCPAQVKTTVTPPGFTTTVGRGLSVFFGGLPDARFQFVATALTGKGAKMVKQVGYRLSKWNPMPDRARSWKRVTLDCAETKRSALSVAFSKNALSTPVRVFDAKVAWPKTAPAFPPKGPAPFAKSYAFPFKKTWSYSGRNDAMLDYRFTGGSFPSGQMWFYLLDAADAGVQPGWVAGAEHGFGSGSACHDSGHRARALCTSGVLVYPKTGYGALNDKLTLTLTSYNTANSSQVVQGLDFSGSLAGRPINSISCNNLYLAGSKSMALFFRRTASSGYAQTMIGPVPYRPAFKGIKLWTQALWNDSMTGKPLLSQASILTIPGQPASGKNSTCVYQTSPKLMSKYGSISQFGVYNPIIQWTH